MAFKPQNKGNGASFKVPKVWIWAYVNKVQTWQRVLWQSLREIWRPTTWDENRPRVVDTIRPLRNRKNPDWSAMSESWCANSGRFPNPRDILQERVSFFPSLDVCFLTFFGQIISRKCQKMFVYFFPNFPADLKRDQRITFLGNTSSPQLNIHTVLSFVEGSFKYN